VEDSTHRSAAAAVPYVLVVDDDGALLELHAQVIREMGFEVETAWSGEEALARVARRCPDILVADLILAGMDGEDLVRQCIPLCPNLRLVFVSGHAPDVLRALGITQVVFLPKPVSPRVLRSALLALLGKEDTPELP
jgi:CheY-like chemotaxis protein